MDEIQFRPICDDDAETLYQCYASTRTEELKVTGWPEQQKEAFLRQQFHAQSVHYAKYYNGSRFHVILVAGSPAGRLYVDVWPSEIRIVDITLLPAYRGRGIGSFLIEQLIAESEGCGKPLSIHVERQNPAMKWYLRLGFEPIGEVGVYDLLRRPTAVSRTDSGS